MPDWKRSTIRTILPLIPARLVTKSVVSSADLIRIVAGDVNDYQDMMNTVEILVAAPDESPGGRHEHGSLRANLVVERMIEVNVRTLNAVDEFGTKAMTYAEGSSAVNHYEVEDDVIDALHGWRPLDSSNNAVVNRPLFYRGTKTVRNRRAADANHKVSSIIYFELAYSRDLTNATSQSQWT